MSKFKENIAKFGKSLGIQLLLIAGFVSIAFFGLQYFLPHASHKTLFLLSVAALVLVYILIKLGSLLIKLAIIIIIAAAIAAYLL